MPDDLSLLAKICVWALIALWLGSFMYAVLVTWERPIFKANLAVVLFVIVVTLIAIPQFATMRHRSDTEVKSNLRALHTACMVYWRDTDPQNDCTVGIASDRYNIVISPEVTITASGNEASFTATASGERRRTWVMNACGKIKLLEQ